LFDSDDEKGAQSQRPRKGQHEMTITEPTTIKRKPSGRGRVPCWGGFNAHGSIIRINK